MKPVLALAVAASVIAFGPPTLAQDAVARGKQVFDHWCYACHKPLNPGDTPVAGTSSLQRTYQGKKPAALEARTDLAPGYVRYIVRHGIKSMPFSRRTEISDPDLDDLAAYLARTR